MRLLISALFCAIVCCPAYAQQRQARTDAAPSSAIFPPCLPIDLRPECHAQAKAVTSQTLGPCLSIFNAIDPENFVDQVKACVSEDVQAVVDNANAEPKDNVALSCWVPVQAIVTSAASGKGGVLLAFQLFRRAKQQGVIANCSAYLQTTLMLQ